MPDKPTGPQNTNTIENGSSKEDMLTELTDSRLNYLAFYVNELDRDSEIREGIKHQKEEIRKKLKTNPIPQSRIIQIVDTIDKAVERLGDKEEKDLGVKRSYDKKDIKISLLKHMD